MVTANVPEPFIPEFHRVVSYRASPSSVTSQILIRLVPVILCLITIYGLTDVSVIPHGLNLNDRQISLIGHAFIYFALAVSVWRVLDIWDFDPWQRLVLAYCGAILFAVGDEWLQGFVPGRQPDLINVVVDAIGAAIGLVVVAILNLRVLAHYRPNGIPLGLEIILRLTPAGLCMAGIFLLSAQPTLPRPMGLDAHIISIAGHFFAYLLLGMSIWWVLGLFPLGDWSRLVLAFAGAVIFGISDEWHQSFVPGRTPDITDIMVDALGAVVGLIIVTVLQGIYRQFRSGNPDG